MFLDFSNVRAVSVPSVDASIGRLLGGRVAGYYDTHPIVIYRASIECCKRSTRLAPSSSLRARAWRSDGAELLGADAVLASTLQEAVRLRTFNVHQLAERLDPTPQAANNRLRLLLRSGAIQRERAKPERGHGGREFRYTVPATA